MCVFVFVFYFSLQLCCSWEIPELVLEETAYSSSINNADFSYFALILNSFPSVPPHCSHFPLTSCFRGFYDAILNISWFNFNMFDVISPTKYVSKEVFTESSCSCSFIKGMVSFRQ